MPAALHFGSASTTRSNPSLRATTQTAPSSSAHSIRPAKTLYATVFAAAISPAASFASNAPTATTTTFCPLPANGAAVAPAATSVVLSTPLPSFAMKSACPSHIGTGSLLYRECFEMSFEDPNPWAQDNEPIFWTD